MNAIGYVQTRLNGNDMNNKPQWHYRFDPLIVKTMPTVSLKAEILTEGLANGLGMRENQTYRQNQSYCLLTGYLWSFGNSPMARLAHATSWPSKSYGKKNNFVEDDSGRRHEQCFARGRLDNISN